MGHSERNYQVDGHFRCLRVNGQHGHVDPSRFCRGSRAGRAILPWLYAAALPAIRAAARPETGDDRCLRLEKSDWRAKPRVQMPDYHRRRPRSPRSRRSWPLSAAGLRRRGAAPARDLAGRRGEAFLLQGGDCAESFAEFSADAIRDTFKVMLQMADGADLRRQGAGGEGGRMAGQFAKPRSGPTETVVDGVELPSYRGDIINGFDFTPEARVPDPERMLQAYTAGRGHAEPAARLFHRRLCRHPPGAQLDAGLRRHDKAERYREIAAGSRHARFHEAAGLDADSNHELPDGGLLHQPRSAAAGIRGGTLCRTDSTSGWLAGSGHMIWIGDRTRQPDGAHVEFARGVLNPIGLKCGPR